jgi:hypothetical protein
MSRAPLESAENEARRIGRQLKASMPPGWGFVVVLAYFGEANDGGFKTYLSSVDRESAMNLLREMADAIESREKGL